ncbi:hypothetical protein ABK040_000125 [Willaertia magna]
MENVLEEYYNKNNKKKSLEKISEMIETSFNLSNGDGILFRNEKQDVEVTVEQGFIHSFGIDMKEGTTLSFSKYKPFYVLLVNNKDQTTVLKVKHDSNDMISNIKDNACTFINQVHELYNNIKKECSHSRILIVGPQDVGKSTLSKILFHLAWFGNNSTSKKACYSFIDIDVGQNQLSIPGTMNLVYNLTTKEEDLKSYTSKFAITNENPLSLIENKISYFFGDISPKSVNFYKHLCNRLNYSYETILKKQFTNEELTNNSTSLDNSSMLLVNTCGWVEGTGYQLIKHAIDAFKITHVISLDSPTTNQLNKDYINRNSLKVIHLEKSPFVKKRSKDYRKNTRETSIYNHFHLRTNTLTLDLSKVKVTMITNDNKVRNLNVTDKSLNRICSIVRATNEKEVIDADTMMLVVLKSFDENNKTITLLLPSNLKATEAKQMLDELPTVYLISGSMMHK